ncbi:MAG: hypothetical protein LQ346_002115 [Caloplaca aetnensis]|nr:MAG: hypothetical protein LQ346_002115 [Caloplaca aetnensis]
MSPTEFFYDPYLFFTVCCIFGFLTILATLDANERLRVRALRYRLSEHQDGSPRLAGGQQHYRQERCHHTGPYTGGDFEVRYEKGPRMLGSRQLLPGEEALDWWSPPSARGVTSGSGPFLRPGGRSGRFQPREPSIPEMAEDEATTVKTPRARKDCGKRAASQNDRGNGRKKMGKKGPWNKTEAYLMPT